MRTIWSTIHLVVELTTMVLAEIAPVEADLATLLSTAMLCSDTLSNLSSATVGVILSSEQRGGVLYEILPTAVLYSRAPEV